MQRLLSCKQQYLDTTSTVLVNQVGLSDIFSRETEQEQGLLLRRMYEFSSSTKLSSYVLALC